MNENIRIALDELLFQLNASSGENLASLKNDILEGIECCIIDLEAEK